MQLVRAIPILLFGLMFAGGGLFLLSKFAMPMWQDWRAMQDWEPAYAQLLSVSGSNNQTKASYRYEVDGLRHQSDRVYVATFKDNIGSYHENILSRLRHHERTREPVTVWVNPLNPEQAVIDRDMRWGLFAFVSGFCSIFILIGLLVMVFGLRTRNSRNSRQRPSLRALRREWRKKQNDPSFELSLMEYAQQQEAANGQQGNDDSTPLDWHTRKGWESPTIRSDAKKGVFAIWGFAIIWNAISAPLLFAMPDELAKGNDLVLLGLLFPVAGAFLVFQAVRSTLEYRRFGTVLLEMDPYPGAIGGHVGGHINITRLTYDSATQPSSQVTVKLECVYSYVSGTGKSRSRRENIKWAQEGHPRIEHAAQGVRLAFRFDIPENLPQADKDQTGAYHFWRLSVKAAIPGVDLNRQYNIPVFHTKEVSRTVRHDLSAQVAEREQKQSEWERQSIAQGNFDLPGLSRAMRFSEYGGEIDMVFPMFRNKALTVIAALFAGGSGFASYSMGGIAFKGGIFGMFTGLFAIPFVLVAVVASIAAIYLPLNNLRVRIARNEITVRRRLLFLPVFFRRLNVTDVSSLRLKRSGSTGQGVHKVEHFKLLAHLRGGHTVTLAEDLDGESTAGHFRDYLARRLNVQAAT